MDELGLATLRDELFADSDVAEGAFHLAQTRFDEKTDSGLEGCGHHLARFYNIVEQMAMRVAERFENRIENDRGWHAETIRKLSIRIEGVRPAFFPVECLQPLRELRGFRHVFTHAYDLQLDREKVQLVLKYAAQVAPRLRSICAAFIKAVAAQENL